MLKNDIELYLKDLSQMFRKPNACRQIRKTVKA